MVTAVGSLGSRAAEPASGDPSLFLGQDFFPWMVLALGAAMVVGNGLALLRPRPDRPPVSWPRSLTMVVLGGVAAVWGLASLLT